MAMVSSDTYQKIQNWITRQQEYETTHSTPAPLTEAQRKLLEKLELTLPPETPPLPGPELGNTNWVGDLMEYRAARQRGLSGVDFKEEPGPTIYGAQKWYCRVQIDEHPVPFPGPDGGLFPDGSQPSFARKRDAKQYAAKCALEWLQANGYRYQTNYNGVKFPQSQAHQAQAHQAQAHQVQAHQVQAHQAQAHQVTPQASPAKKKPRLSAPSPEQARAEPNNNVSVTQMHLGSPLPKGIASPFNNDEVSAVHQVSQLCDRLGFPGVPQYKYTPDSEMTGFYDGYPDLGMLTSRLPSGVGRVEKVLGKKATREKIAEELLEHLRKLVAQQDEKDKQFLANLPPIRKEEQPQAPA
ncbi:hypothetical protein F4677DRAFT_446955 [Hypoxylon crocopeplum]|nr:hypothetical protein F4677DRAFT_446955 [Hypoxylon crocopeplum]